MIAWLSGRLRSRHEGRLVVEVGGVGWEVHVPLSVAGQARIGDEIELHVFTHLRQERIQLLGFEDEEQQRAFEALIEVSGIGPRLALSILGGISPADLRVAIELEDIARLKALPGVGNKLALRLGVELRGKLDLGQGSVPELRAPPGEPSLWRDLASALHNLDYRQREVEETLARVRRELPDGSFDALLRAALGHLRR